MVTRSSFLAWKIPWMEEPGRLYSPWGRQESDRTSLSLYLSCLEFVKFLEYVDFTKMHQNWEAFSHCFFKDFLCFLSNSHDMMFDLLLLLHSSLRFCSFFI